MIVVTTPSGKIGSQVIPHLLAADETLRVVARDPWTGQGGSAVLGPENLSFDEMAAIMSDVLGKTVRFQQVPADTYKAQLILHGANQIFAQGIVNMLIAKDNGMDNVELRTTQNTTPTSFHQWCEEVLKPAVLG